MSGQLSLYADYLPSGHTRPEIKDQFIPHQLPSTTQDDLYARSRTKDVLPALPIPELSAPGPLDQVSQATIVAGSSSPAATPQISDTPPVLSIPPPTNPVLYTFSTHTFNSMMLQPKESHQGLKTYHISVSMNCFIPSSFITTVRRDSESGEFVGNFEMGDSTNKATLRIHGRHVLIASALSIHTSENVLKWSFSKKHLVWDYTNHQKLCCSSDLTITYATLTPSTVTRLPLSGEVDPSPLEAQLMIFPEGYDVMDDILLSALILERRRLKKMSFWQRVFGPPKPF